jgi:hypothetical protein
MLGSSGLKITVTFPCLFLGMVSHDNFDPVDLSQVLKLDLFGLFRAITAAL